jgi:hypothetical protein
MFLKMLRAVLEAAEDYWNTGTDHSPVEITGVWIAGKDSYGDTEVKVSWISEETKDTGNDHMIYTVSVLDGDELYIHGPEW